ncbi:MAG: membrane protein insertion efficiency factor YidD [Spirochaetota bacterium]
MGKTNPVLLVLRTIILLPVWLYRYAISPLLPGRCIYSPSCSLYTEQAIKKHGIIRGLLLGIFRVFRCHSMFTGGDDPVPETVTWRSIKNGYKTFYDRS